MSAQLARVIQVLICIFTLTHATRITVDDTDTSYWRYSGSWWARPSQSCLCWIQPDQLKLFNGTHHQTTDPRGYAEFTFTGTALEVYVVCPANIPDAGHYFTSFTFSLDGVADGSFQGPQPYCDGFVYNLLAYARHNLISEPHTFRIINTNVTRVNPVDLETAIVLDYAVYDDGTGSTSISNGSVYDGGGSNVSGSDLGKGAIAGITIGCTFVVVALAATVLYVRRWRLRRTSFQTSPAQVAGAIGSSGPTSPNQDLSPNSFRPKEAPVPAMTTYATLPPRPGPTHAATLSVPGRDHMPHQYLMGSGVGMSAYPTPMTPTASLPPSATLFVPSASHLTEEQAQVVQDLMRQNVPAHTIAGVINAMSPVSQPWTSAASTSASARTDAPPGYDFKAVT